MEKNELCSQCEPCVVTSVDTEKHAVAVTFLPASTSQAIRPLRKRSHTEVKSGMQEGQGVVFLACFTLEPSKALSTEQALEHLGNK